MRDARARSGARWGKVLRGLEHLEGRLLLSATDPSAEEQQSLWLLNRMRTNPAAELPLLLNSGDLQVKIALAYFHVDEALLAQQWSLLTAVPALAWNSTLGAAAKAHNDLMQLQDAQAHQLAGELKLGQRVLAAGYDYAWVGENIYSYAQSAFYAHAGFAIDWGNAATDVGGIQTPPGHRNNMMSKEYREVGIAMKADASTTNTVGPNLITQDFGRTMTTQNAWLVGTVFNDVDADEMYDLADGVGGVTVTAVGAGGTFVVTSRTAGGYQVQLPAGSYEVTFSGGTLAGVAQMNVTVGVDNVLRDVDTAQIVGGLPPDPDPEPPTPPTPVNRVPVGALDTPARLTIGAFDMGPRKVTGWAFDAEAGAGPLQVRVDIDGVAGPVVTANLERGDLGGTTVVGTAHGFSVDLPWLSAGEHTLTLVGMDNPSEVATTLASVSVTVAAKPVGYVDVFNTTRIGGWAFDPGAAEATKIRIDMDGTEWATVTADKTRGDLTGLLGSAGHGFALTLGEVVPGAHEFAVWALDDTTGENTLLGSGTLRFNTLPVGYLDSVTSERAAGWAQDADDLGTAVKVRIDVDGVTEQTVTADLFRADLVTVGTGYYSFNVALPTLEVGTHTVEMYVIDGQTGAERRMGEQRLTVEAVAVLPVERAPVGYLDLVSGTTLMGWAADLDAPSTAVKMRVDVDGVAVYTGVTDVDRADLLAFLPDARHGYVIDLAGSLAPGEHTVEVYALNVGDGTPTLLATRVVGTAAPIGYVDVSSQRLLMGWAYQSDLGGGAVTVSLEIDGVEVLRSAADYYRADLAALFGTGNHGFLVMLPTVEAGTHQVTLRMLDSLGNVKGLLKDTGMVFA